MADALATLFEAACPRLNEHDITTDDWRVTVDDGATLTVAVLIGGGGWASMTERRERVEVGDVVVSTGGSPLTLAGDTTTPRPRRVLIGSYEFGGTVCDRALTGLSPLVIDRANRHTLHLMALLEEENVAGRAGREAIVTRVLDLMAVTAIRAWMEANPNSSPAWACAHDDPVVNRALELIHQSPGAAWTLESLARRSGSSRSALARRFGKMMGESPMGYLTCWRLCLAADLLAKTDRPLASIAAAIGYANPYAFSAAFHRHYGYRPGEHRRRNRV